MTSPAFDPEVQALLDEMVTDPNSTLLKIPEAPLSKWLAKREPPVSTGEAFLTRVERYLLQEYREEAALLLAQACQSALLSKPLEETRIHRHITGGFALEPVDRGELQEKAFRLASFPAASSFRAPLEMLGLESTPSQLAAASLRIAPRDETRIWMAIALNQEGQHQSAMRVLLDVLSHHPSRMNELYARGDCGSFQLGLGEYEKALDWYRTATRMAEAGPSEHMSWMVSAVFVGLPDEARIAATSLAGMTRERDPWVVEFEAFASRMMPTRECTELLSSIADDLPPVAKRIADVIT